MNITQDPFEQKSFDQDITTFEFDGKSIELVPEWLKKLGKIRFVMSNAKVDLVTENFREYFCEDIAVKRAINSKNPGLLTTEVLIYN